MDILSLVNMKYFCDAVTLGGITAASKANFVTQSAISQGIAKLEASLKCSLLVHHPNRFRLTSEGELAFQQISEILKRTTEFQKHFPQQANSYMGDLSFGCTFTLGGALIPPYLKKFRDSYPLVNTSIQVEIVETLIKMVKNNIIEFALIPRRPKEALAGLESRVIYKSTTNLYTSPKIKKSEEKKQKFILDQEIFSRDFEQKYLEKYQKAPEVFLRTSVPMVAMRFVQEGLGIGLLFDYPGIEQNPLLRRVDLKLKLLPFEIFAVYLSGTKLRQSSEIFLSFFDQRGELGAKTP